MYDIDEKQREAFTQVYRLFGIKFKRYGAYWSDYMSPSIYTSFMDNIEKATTGYTGRFYV